MYIHLQEESEAMISCKSCGEVLKLSDAAFDGLNYRHVLCHHKWEKAMDNARDYTEEIKNYRREKDGG